MLMEEGVAVSGTAWISLAERERIARPRARREGEKVGVRKRADQSIAVARSLFTATVEKET